MGEQRTNKVITLDNIKAITDTLKRDYITKAGGTMYGAIAMSENKITGLANGTDDQDAATVSQMRETVTGVLGNIAPEYDARAAYDVGDYCVHDGTMYRCCTPIPEGGEAWNAEHWTAVTLVEAIEENDVTAGDGLVIDGGEIGLNEAFYNYLVAQTFKAPSVSLVMSRVSGEHEVGDVLTITQFTHRETNTDNIRTGTLRFYRANVEKQTIEPQTAETVVALLEPFTEAGDAEGSVTYKLQCTDTLGGTRTASVTATWNRYVYAQVGEVGTIPTNALTCAKQTKVSTFEASGARFNYTAGKCLWLLTPKAGARIETYVLGEWADVTGQEAVAESVSFTQENGTVATYCAYRTGVFEGSGTAEYRVR